MHRVWQTVLYLAAVTLCLGSRAHGADDIITWIRKCGGTVRAQWQITNFPLVIINTYVGLALAIRISVYTKMAVEVPS